MRVGTADQSTTRTWGRTRCGTLPPTAPNKGMGYTGIRDGVIYDGGLRLEADADLPPGPCGPLRKSSIWLNVNGQIQKASSSSQSKKEP